jgi:hypothetical protein
MPGWTRSQNNANRQIDNGMSTSEDWMIGVVGLIFKPTFDGDLYGSLFKTRILKMFARHDGNLSARHAYHQPHSSKLKFAIATDRKQPEMETAGTGNRNLANWIQNCKL